MTATNVQAYDGLCDEMIAHYNKVKIKKGKLMKLLTTKIKIIIAVVASVLLMGIGVYAGIQLGKNTKDTQPQAVALSFKDIGELATTSAYITEVNEINDPKKFFEITIPFTTSRLIVSETYIIKAGYDFEKIIPEITEPEEDGTGTIQIALPEPTILSNEARPETRKIWLESESIFNNIPEEKRNELEIQMKNDAEATAIGNGLYDEARENAEKVLKSFIENFDAYEGYDIVFTDAQ